MLPQEEPSPYLSEKLFGRLRVQLPLTETRPVRSEDIGVKRRDLAAFLLRENPLTPPRSFVPTMSSSLFAI